MGLPLCLLAFGKPSLAPAVIATIMTVCVLFGIAIVLIELGLQAGSGIGATLWRVAKSLGKNPLLIAPVALGLFLGANGEARNARTTSALVALKLLAQPLLTWWLAVQVFALPPLWAKSAVILSALPTGTGPFMLAEFYRREGSVTSSTILFSTVLSLVTVTLCLALMV